MDLKDGSGVFVYLFLLSTNMKTTKPTMCLSVSKYCLRYPALSAPSVSKHISFKKDPVILLSRWTFQFLTHVTEMEVNSHFSGTVLSADNLLC